ncbi:putative DNA-directed RNA polymerase [Helianthus annuus]|nr:putative DNA-directed RNA polymerase [Helianthus annuus]
MEEMENRMGIKINAVRDMMLDRFSGVDQKLTAIEQLLKKIIEPQSQTGNPPENMTDKSTGEEGTRQDKGKKAAVGGGDGWPSHESGPDKPLQAQISPDGDDQETDYQTRGPPKGLHLGDSGRQGLSHESGPNKPLQAQISSDGDDQGTDNHTRGPPGGFHLGDGGRQGPSHEFGSDKPLRAQISSNGEHQETDDQIRDPPGGLHLGDGGKQSPSHVYGPKKPLQAQLTSDGDDPKTDNQIRDPPGGFHFGDRGRHGPNKPLQAQISSDGDGQGQGTDDQIQGPPGGFHLGDRGRQGPPWEAGSSCGWVGLYTHRYGTYNQTGPGYSFGTDFCGPAWVGLHDFSKKNGPQLGSHKSKFKGQPVNNDIEKVLSYSGEKFVKTGQDDIFKEGDNKPQAQVVTEGSNKRRPKTRRGKRKVNKADVTGPKISCAGSSGKTVVETGQDKKMADNTDVGGEDKEDEKTHVLLEDSSKPDQCEWSSAVSDKGLDWSKLANANTDSQHGSGAPWGKKGNDKPQAQAVTEGSNEKGHEENQNCGSKRRHPDSPLGGPNDGPISSGPFTTSKQRVDMLTTDEQEIHLNETEPIMKSIQRIMHYKGYNDGDPLSAEDQTYILENVLNHHPEKAQKMGAGVNYIMVDKHMKFQESRCFYIVSIDGRKEDFSYHKCLKNFTSEKYPKKVDEFIPKYFKSS